MKTKYKILSLALSALLACGALAGCANTAPNTENTTVNTAPAQQNAADKNADDDAGEETADDGTDTDAASEKSGIAVSAEDRFTARDKETGYDEASAVKIALSDAGSTADGDGVSVNGSTVTITAAGTYVLSGSLTNGQIVVDADKNDKLQLVLDNVTVANGSTAPLYVKTADKVFVTLAPGSKNTLENTGDFIAIDDNNIDGCVYSKEDITFNGGGSLTVSSETGHGIVSKDSLVITSGSYNITAGGHGLQGKDDVSILDGDIGITCGEDGIHSENSDDADLGTVLIQGGSLTVEAGDDGIHAGNYVTVNGGKINVTKSYEGIEGQEVNLNGGEITVRASDDGVNAAGGADRSGFGAFKDSFGGSANAAVNITGGTVTVIANGDGVDSNGALNVSGGTLYVSGPTNAGNGALDHDGSATITGGTVIAAGAAGMAQNFSAGTQCSMLVNLNGGAGDEITVKDASGRVLASFSPEKACQTVVISTPDLTVGETYTVTAGSESATVELTTAIYGGTGGMMGGMGGRGGMGGMAPGMDGQQPGMDNQQPGMDNQQPGTGGTWPGGRGGRRG